MSTMRVFLSALGLPLLVLACAPVSRTYGSGGGGATSSSSADASSAATGGSGGSGGKALTASCTNEGTPFDILTKDELGTASLDDSILLAPDQENVGMVHVILSDVGKNQIIVRTVVDDPKRLANLSYFGNASAPVFSPRAAWGGGGRLHIEGVASNAIQELNFNVDPTNGVAPDGKVDGYQTPIQCLQGGYTDQLAFAQDGEKARFVVVCRPNVVAGPPPLTRLFAGGWTGAPVQLAADVPDVTLMRPDLYAFVGGKHIVFFTSMEGTTFFGQGTTVEELTTLQPLRFTTDPAARQGIFALAPTTASDGIALIGAHINPTTEMGQYWTGSALAKDYAALSQEPSPGFVAAQDIATVKEAVTPSPLGWNAQGAFSAGVVPDKKSVHMFWLTREGKSLIFGQEIYKSADTVVRGASAAPLGSSATLVVWVERTGTAAPYAYQVRGQRVSCKLD